MRRRGMTLLEVVLVVALLAGAAAILAGFFGGGRAAIDSGVESRRIEAFFTRAVMLSREGGSIRVEATSSNELRAVRTADGIVVGSLAAPRGWSFELVPSARFDFQSPHGAPTEARVVLRADDDGSLTLEFRTLLLSGATTAISSHGHSRAGS